MVDAGIRIFRINGAYFHCKEYEKLVEELNEIFANLKLYDKPTILFDLKGPIPRITKLGGNKQSNLEVKQGQQVKIIHENPKIEDNDVIHIDRKIIQSINIGDIIMFDSSKCILKVMSFDKYKRKSSISKLVEPKSSHRLVNQNLHLELEQEFDEKELIISNPDPDNEENEFFQDIFQNTSLNGNFLPTIEEERDDFQIEDNLDFSFEERLMQKQTKMKLAYQNIVNKHKVYNDQNRINEIERLNISIASEDTLKSTEDENRIYREKRARIRSSIASMSNQNANNMIICEVCHAGSIYLHKKVFLFEKEIVSELGANPIGVKDIVDIHKTSNIGINIITLLVNNVENIQEIRELVGEKVNDLMIFARIETSEAIYNFDSILESSDGIILQQGLLSSIIPYEDLCLIEMYMMEKCKIMQKPIFMQTNILKSMTRRVKPLVTEISNIDHAVNEGIDGLILKDELTMADNHQVILKLLKGILLEMEALSDTKAKYEEFSKFFKLHRNFTTNDSIESLLDCAVKTSFDIEVGLIILFTDELKFAKTLSKFRPSCRIVCVAKDQFTFNYLRLIRGVSPILLCDDDSDKEGLQENLTTM